MGNDYANAYKEFFKQNRAEQRNKLISSIAESIKILGMQATLDIVAKELDLDISDEEEE